MLKNDKGQNQMKSLFEEISLCRDHCLYPGVCQDMRHSVVLHSSLDLFLWEGTLLLLMMMLFLLIVST